MPKLDADWLTTPPSLAVLTALEAAKPAGTRFVGGCVRNSVMGRPVDDFDLATQLVPQETLAALAAASIRAIPTGIEHGTVTAVVDKVAFEITSLRRDVETDGRRAVVAFTQDWTEDAQRRDFRMNALYAAPDGTLFDPTGGGYDDALAGRVIFIGDGDQRLVEDYLRILRFFRFNAWYGAELDADGLAACARQVEGLGKIARERVWKEFRKFLAAPDIGTVLGAMASSGVLDKVLPPHIGVDGVHDLRVSEQLAGVQPDPILRLMALIPRSAEAIEQTSETLRLSNADKARLTAWAADNLPELAGMTGRDLRAALYWHGEQAIVDRAMLSGVDARDILAAARSWRRPDFPINGDDALAAGYKGRDIGAALSRVGRSWVDSDFQLQRDALLALL